MDYKSRVEALYKRHTSVQTAGFSAGAYKPGLEGMERLSQATGHPHRAYRTVHVAGTNGKGSVCSMIAAGLASRGLRVGLYTSPHLVDFRERMKIVSGGGFEMISEDEVCSFLDRYDCDGPSFFEITTAMAFKWFADRGVDYAVVETGLGGRLDSTNIITPELAVITSIGLDHCALLGDTVQKIAAEKAGIFKKGVPALVWGREPDTSPVFEKAAAAAGAPLHFADDFYSPLLSEGNFTDLQGPCQLTNLRTALSALTLLGAGAAPGLAPALSTVARTTGLRARWEHLPTGVETIVDIAHNPPALGFNFRRLDALRSAGGDPSCKRPLLVVFGMMADKDVSSVASLLPADARYFLVAPATPRAMSVSDLALKLKSLNFTRSGSVAAGVEQALSAARELRDPIVYIGGSNYVAAEAIEYIEQL